MKSIKYKLKKLITSFTLNKYTHDTLTGLYNRKSFFNKAKKLFKKDPNTKRYMIASNIKDFKLINALFGSKTGDAILKKQGYLMRIFSNEYDIGGRISDDKFAIILPKENYNKKVFIYGMNESDTNKMAENFVGMYSAIIATVLVIYGIILGAGMYVNE